MYVIILVFVLLWMFFSDHAAVKMSTSVAIAKSNDVIVHSDKVA